MWTVYLANNQIITEEECKWPSLPSYPIIKLEWQLPNGRSLVMKGFESYLYLFENYELFQFSQGVKRFKDTVNFLGKKGNEVFQFSYHLRYNKAFQIKNEWNLEFRPLKISPLPRINKKEPKRFSIGFGSPSKTNHANWHEGVILPLATCKII